MMAASSWGVPPWEITGEPVTMWSRQKWLMRYGWANEMKHKTKPDQSTEQKPKVKVKK